MSKSSLLKLIWFVTQWWPRWSSYAASEWGHYQEHFFFSRSRSRSRTWCVHACVVLGGELDPFQQHCSRIGHLLLRYFLKIISWLPILLIWSWSQILVDDEISTWTFRVCVCVHYLNVSCSHIHSHQHAFCGFSAVRVVRFSPKSLSFALERPRHANTEPTKRTCTVCVPRTVPVRMHQSSKCCNMISRLIHLFMAVSALASMPEDFN